MTLEEAIKHYEDVANAKCDSCGAEHRQLTEWLQELRLYRMASEHNQKIDCPVIIPPRED